MVKTCVVCGRLLDTDRAWKGDGERYFCNEFCADADGPVSPSIVPDAGAETPVPTIEGSR
jgi:hypothetical protein